MAININTKYRINRNLDQEEDMKYLGSNGLKIFDSYSQILVVSALIGLANHAYVPIEKTAESVLMQFFTPREQDLINLIAYAHEHSQSVLREDGTRMYEIFEAYANGGFPILCKKIGVDLIDKSKNDRVVILRNYFSMLLQNDIKL